jgi:hypothetical protein
VVQQGKELGHWEGKDAQLVRLDAPAGRQRMRGRDNQVGTGGAEVAWLAQRPMILS